MTHQLSADDRRFRADFEACRAQPAEFDHQAHVRLAHVYLAEHDAEAALGWMQDALRAFIRRNGGPESKYHKTLTRAWVLAAPHLMAGAEPARSAEEFIARNPRLLDSGIVLTHYSAEAQAGFVEPDREGSPGHLG